MLNGRCIIRRDDSVYIRHILDAARKAVSFIERRKRDDLDIDEMLALSLVRLLEVAGEACNRVSSSFRENNPQVPWKKMIDMRNRLIHGYIDIDYDIVWDTVSRDLPILISSLVDTFKPHDN